MGDRSLKFKNAKEAIDDYYDSFPDKKFEAIDLMKLIFLGMWVKYGIYEYDQMAFHRAVWKLKKNVKKNIFIRKLMQNINFRYISAQNQMMSGAIDEAITMLQISEIIALDTGNNYRTFEYLLREKYNRLRIKGNKLVKLTQDIRSKLLQDFGISSSMKDLDSLIIEFKKNYQE